MGEALSHAVIEIGLCNPNNHLTYVGTYRCDAIRRLSEKYSFNNTIDNKATTDPLTKLGDIPISTEEINSLVANSQK